MDLKVYQIDKTTLETTTLNEDYELKEDDDC